MRSPLPSKSMSENWGRADMLCLSIHVRQVPAGDVACVISCHTGSEGPSMN